MTWISNLCLKLWCYNSFDKGILKSVNLQFNTLVCWFARPMEQMACQPSAWCSKNYSFFHKILQNSLQKPQFIFFSFFVNYENENKEFWVPERTVFVKILRRLSLSADLCIHSYLLSQLRQASHRKMIQISALILRLWHIKILTCPLYKNYEKNNLER